MIPHSEGMVANHLIVCWLLVLENDVQETPPGPLVSLFVPFQWFAGLDRRGDGDK